MYESGKHEKVLEYRRKTERGLLWVATRITEMADPESGDILAYFMTTDFNERMIYRKITGRIIEQNFISLAYCELDTGILYVRVLKNSAESLFSSCLYSQMVDMQVTRSGESAPQTVAVCAGGYLAAEIAKEYPGLKQIPYQTFAECMNAVLKKDADCVFLNYYQATYYRLMNAYENLNYQPVENITQNLSLGITKDSNPALLGILSKSIHHLSSGKLQSILSENSVYTNALSFDVLMKRYPTLMAVAFAFIGILTGLFIFLIVTSSVRKRQNLRLAEAKREAENANAAKTDFLSRMSHGGVSAGRGRKHRMYR